MSRKRSRNEVSTNIAGAIPSPSQFNGEPDKQYFDSYGHLGIHEAMIRDTVRTEAYYNAILQHRHLFDGKVVIDVGCGTGILSIFCAWAGARRVYGLEASEMATHARNVVQENGLDHIITIVQGKVEDLDLQDEEGKTVVADAIVSEWMGYFLYYESMFESVINARQKWLSPDGVMFPTHAALFMGLLTDDQYYGDRVYFWRQVYGASMSCLYSHAKKCSFDSVIVDTVHPMQCYSNHELVKFVDCKTCSIEEVQEWKARFNFKSTIVTNFHGFVGYFIVYFSPDSEIFAHLGEKAPRRNRQTNPLNPYSVPKNDELLPPPVPSEENPHLTKLSEASHLLWSKIQTKDPGLQDLFSLSTSPEHQTTHWQHSLFFTSDQLTMVQDQELEGMIEVGQHKENKRFLDISVHWTIKPPPATQPSCPSIAASINENSVPGRATVRPPHAPKPVLGYACDNGYTGYGHGFSYQRGNPMDGQPDLQNQNEEPNPPQRPDFKHSKSFGFK